MPIKGLTMQRFYHALIVICLLMISSAQASGFRVGELVVHPMLTVTGGGLFNNNAGASDSIPAHDGVFTSFQYTSAKNKQNTPFGGVLLGIECPYGTWWSWQAGVSYYRYGQLRAKGLVMQGVDASSQNQYPYQYTINSQQVLAEGKVFYNWQPHYHPYLDLGLGAGFNKFSNYQATLLPAFTTFSNQFGNNSSTSFSYLVGVGVDVDITSNIRYGIGYRFTNLGRVQSGTSMIDTIATSNTISRSAIYGNQLLGQLIVLM